MRNFVVLLLLWLFGKAYAQQAQPAISITKLATGKIIHRFFDTSPISPSGKYVALFRFPSEIKSPKPGDAGEVVLVDIVTKKERVVAKSHGFEMQLGANVQWGNTDNELYFNDVDAASWKAFAVQLNPFTGKSRNMNGTVFMVSPNGKQLASYNLCKSRYAQIGYGVIVPDNVAKRNIGPVEDDGIYVTDVETGKCKMITSIKNIYEQSKPPIDIPKSDKYEFYCFQVKWNPQGTRLLTTLEWHIKDGTARVRNVITMKPDGTDIRTAVTNEQWSKGGHHVNWMPDGDHLSMNLNLDGVPGLEIINVKYDGTDMKIAYPKGSGHPSYHPKSWHYIITDAYAGEMPLPNGKSPLRLINTDTQTETVVAQVDLPAITDYEFRVDAHPAWDRSGRYVVFNGNENGTRCVFMADLKNVLHPPTSKY